MATRSFRRLGRAVLICGALPVTGCVAPRTDISHSAAATVTQAGTSPQADPRYTPEALMQAFQKLCETLGYRAIRAQIDDSEFPYLVYGVIAERCEYADVRETLATMRGYAYSGCVVVQQRDGAYSLFSLNMIPRTAYPQDARSAQSLLRRMRELAVTQH